MSELNIAIQHLPIQSAWDDQQPHSWAWILAQGSDQ